MTVFDKVLCALFGVIGALILWIGLAADTFPGKVPDALVTERNEWGQLPASKERMCEATILQWSEWCSE